MSEMTEVEETQHKGARHLGIGKRRKEKFGRCAEEECYDGEEEVEGDCKDKERGSGSGEKVGGVGGQVQEKRC